MRCVAPFVLLAGLLVAAWGLPGCQSAPAERPDTLVDLATVQSGPRVQADELDGALRRQPNNVALLSRRAALRLAAGQPSAALLDAAAALDLTDGDDDGPLYFLQARALRMLDRLPEALVAARRAADNGLTGPELPLLVGETHLAARDYPAALDNLDRALRLDPDQPAALFYKGLAYAASADTAQALDYLRAALAREPRQPEILHQLAFLYNALGDPEQAVRYAALGLRLDTASGALHYDYGRQLELKGVTDSAAWFYRRALVLDTTQYRADYRLALVAGIHGQRSASLILHLARALRRNPRLPGARALLAEALEEHSQLPAALAQYRLLVAENPGNAHWTYKAWKVSNRARLLLPDSLRPAPLYYPGPPRARPSAVVPLAPVGGLSPK